MISNEFVPKNPLSFSCEKCDYITSNKKDYNKHINTTKHKINENQCFSIPKSPKNNIIYLTILFYIFTKQYLYYATTYHHPF